MHGTTARPHDLTARGGARSDQQHQDRSRERLADGRLADVGPPAADNLRETRTGGWRAAHAASPATKESCSFCARRGAASAAVARARGVALCRFKRPPLVSSPRASALGPSRPISHSSISVLRMEQLDVPLAPGARAATTLIACTAEPCTAARGSSLLHRLHFALHWPQMLYMRPAFHS